MDITDFLSRECGELFSQILMQCPVPEREIFEAAEQCLAYQRTEYKNHPIHRGDEYALECAKKASDILQEQFPVADIEINAKGVVKTGNPGLNFYGNVFSPVLIRIRNKTTEDRFISMESSSLNLWREPVDPWNTKKDPSVPSSLIPANKTSWMVATVITDVSDEKKWDIVFSEDGSRYEINFKANIIPSFELNVLTKSGSYITPAEIFVETSAKTLQVPYEHRNYMHVTPSGLHPYFYCSGFISSSGNLKIYVPEGKTRIICRKGFEFIPDEKIVDIKEDTTITIELSKEKDWDLFADGWISGDTHVHWAKTWVYMGDDTADLEIIQKASDCHVISVLTLSQFDGFQEVFTPVHHPAGLINERSDDKYIMAMDEEFRNSGPYGHVNILGLKNLIVPVSTGFTKTDTYPDYPDNSYAFIKAREQGAIAMCSHGIHTFDKVLIALGLMDCVDQVDISQYYQMLNCGFKLPVTVGTDSNARPLGKMRTYVYTDNGFSYEKWLNGIKKGRTFVTNGPLVKFSVNGKIAGTVIDINAGSTLCVEVSCYSINPLKTLEIVFNGEVIKRVSNIKEEKSFSIKEIIETGKSGWIAVRASCTEVCDWLDYGESAHTSPVYIRYCKNEMKPIEDDVKAVITEIEDYLLNLPEKAVFENSKQESEVCDRVKKALDIYRDRLI